jgi:hypothetical protein
MKTALCILTLALLQLAAYASLDTDIPETNRVVLKLGAWTPTSEETQKALLAVQSFMETSPPASPVAEKDAVKKILQNTRRYRVQFTGILREGKKMIWCNFFPAPDSGKKDQFENWTRVPVAVLGGGSWFWQVSYDLSTGNCLNFVCNALE